MAEKEKKEKGVIFPLRLYKDQREKLDRKSKERRIPISYILRELIDLMK